MRPCPGCGTEPIIKEENNTYHVECTCGWQGPKRNNSQEAIDIWNQRIVNSTTISTSNQTISTINNTPNRVEIFKKISIIMAQLRKTHSMYQLLDIEQCIDDLTTYKYIDTEIATKLSNRAWELFGKQKAC